MTGAVLARIGTRRTNNIFVSSEDQFCINYLFIFFFTFYKTKAATIQLSPFESIQSYPNLSDTRGFRFLSFKQIFAVRCIYDIRKILNDFFFYFGTKDANEREISIFNPPPPRRNRLKSAIARRRRIMFKFTVPPVHRTGILLFPRGIAEINSRADFEDRRGLKNEGPDFQA